MKLNLSKLSPLEKWNLISSIIYRDSFFVDKYIDFLKQQVVLTEQPKKEEQLIGTPLQHIFNYACGDGTLTLKLAEHFKVTAVDQNLEIIAQAKAKQEELKKEEEQKAKQENRAPSLLPITYRAYTHQDLEKEIENTYDAVICRANRINTTCWTFTNEKERDKYLINPERKKQDIIKTIKELYRMTKPGGLLYLDTTSMIEFEEIKRIEEKNKTHKTYDKYTLDLKKPRQRTHLFFKIKHDKKPGVRIIHANGIFRNNELDTVTMYYNLMNKEELIQLVKENCSPVPLEIYSPPLEILSDPSPQLQYHDIILIRKPLTYLQEPSSLINI